MQRRSRRRLARRLLELCRLYAGWPDARARHRQRLALLPYLGRLAKAVALLEQLPNRTAYDRRRRAAVFRACMQGYRQAQPPAD